jgi:hypothetical protein
LKIAGVVNNYDEALAIEEITKVFIIEERILNFTSLSKKVKYKNARHPIIKIFPANDNQKSEHIHKKNIHVKNNEDDKAVFNVRGLG